jgi:hypothetical protein
VSTEAHLAAIKALLTAAGAKPYDIGELAALTTLPTSYTEVHVMPRLPGEERLGVWSGTQSYRVVTRAVARTHQAATVLRDRAADALQWTRFEVDGGTAGPITRELADDPIGDDEDWFSGTSSWTYST